MPIDNFPDGLQKRLKDLANLLNNIAKNYVPAVFSSSFGAEDMLLTDLIAREALPIEIVTLDTGRLKEETYELIQATKKKYAVAIKIYFPRHDLLEDFVEKHGINAFYDSLELRKNCCRIRKIEPLQRALSGKKAWITGLRSAQSATRSSLPIQEFNTEYQLTKFNPLSDWSEKEIWSYIKARQVPYNRLHDKFYPSIGCAPCTRAITLGEDIRAGRWWWEDPQNKECGLHRATKQTTYER